MCRIGLAVAEHYVVQPRGYCALLGAEQHQVADRLEHCLEIVLLRLPTQHYVERAVHILGFCN